jgi:hypothetical protein
MKRWEPWRIEEVTVSGQKQLLYHNNRYHVFLRKDAPVGDCPYERVWLSIRNNDRSTRRDWRDFQRIKNEIVGPQVEMVELYPQEDHKVDTSNQYHLWGYNTTEPVFTNAGLGWQQGKTVWDGKSPHSVPGTEKAVQRPTDEESTV